MFRAKFLLPVFVFVAAVAVGCTQRPTATAVGGDRALEVKVAKLEKDLKGLHDEATKARAEAKQQIDTAAQQVADLSKEREDLKALLKARTGERDTLQAVLKARTGERDVVQSQFDSFRKDLKELLGKMDAAGGPAAPPAVTALGMPSLAR